MDWESLRNIFLQYLEENIQKWNKDFEKAYRETLKKLKEQGYEITPELQNQLNQFAKEKIEEVKSLLKEVVVATTGLSLKDPLVDKIIKEVFNYRYPDGLNLSERLWDWSAELKHGLKQALQNALSAGRSADAIKYELQSIIDKYKSEKRAIVLKEKLPKWIEDLKHSAKRALKDPKAIKEFEKKLEKAQKYVEKLSKEGSYYSAKHLLKQFEKAVNEGKEYLIDKSIQHHLYQKQLTRLKTIARTESANAYHKAQIEMTIQDEDLLGYKWNLSRSHPKPDICDYLANVNYGLGKGIHPKDKVPRAKAHPNCMCYLTPVYSWETKGKEKEKPKVNKKVLERFAPKYIKELVKEGFDITELFDEKRKAFIPKREVEAMLRQKRFEKIQKAIEERFIKNLEKLDTSSKERFTETFPNLWKKKKRFQEHIKQRIAKGHIPMENAEIFYAKKIIETLAFHDKVIIEKAKGKFQSTYAVKEDWIVVLSEKGKIETAFKLDIPLQIWIETHKLKGAEVKENVYSETIKEATKELWNRVRLF